MVSFAVLPYALIAQYKNDKIESECSQVAAVKDQSETLRIFMYFEEVIILLAILSSISMILKTKQVFHNLVSRYK